MTESREQLKERNLDAFRRYQPFIHAKLASYKALAELVFDEEGEPDVLFRNERFYGTPLSTYVAEQLEMFWRFPVRLPLSLPQPENFDAYVMPLLARVMTRAVDEGLEFSAHYTSRQAFFLSVFGIGLGAHLDELVEETDCRCLILFEPNLEFIHHSLEVYDWTLLFETMAERSGKLHIFAGEPVQYVADETRRIMRATCPIALDGAMFYTHYRNSYFERITQFLQEKSAFIMAGLGFIDDEIIMLRQTYANLSAGDVPIYCRTEKERSVSIPAFIVGSGPSVDADMPFVKANAEMAIIIACGTGIRPLLKAGITPDFHVELENVAALLPLIDQAYRQFDLSPVWFVGSTTVNAKVPTYYEKKIYFFRAALSCTPIFSKSEDWCPARGGPTVANVALGFAQGLGFKEYYFFGTDMGTKREGLRHSLESWQNTDEGCEADHVFDVPVHGNFGGTVYTYKDLDWTRDELETAIKEGARGVFYYNCSDGAHIRGTIAKHARTIDLEEVPGGKRAVVEDLVGRFPVYRRADLDQAWSDERMRELIEQYCDRLVAILDEYEDEPAKRYLTEFMKWLVPDHSIMGIAMLFRGTVFQGLAATEFYQNRVLGGEEQSKRMKAICWDELRDLIEELRTLALDQLGTLSETAPKLREREPNGGDPHDRAAES